MIFITIFLFLLVLFPINNFWVDKNLVKRLLDHLISIPIKKQSARDPTMELYFY